MKGWGYTVPNLNHENLALNRNSSHLKHTYAVASPKYKGLLADTWDFSLYVWVFCFVFLLLLY